MRNDNVFSQRDKAMEVLIFFEDNKNMDYRIAIVLAIIALVRAVIYIGDMIGVKK